VDATSRKYREASIEGADGVVTHKPYSNNAFRNLACERPPRIWTPPVKRTHVPVLPLMEVPD
jgi:hypothetical protein